MNGNNKVADEAGKAPPRRSLSGAVGSVTKKVAQSAFMRVGADGFNGGEGVALLLKIRAEHHSDWPRTLFAVEGRSMSWGILFIYSGMVCAIVLPLMLLINWASPPSVLVNLTELKTPLGFAGTCLFFLLVFRNNSSYDRWWEGRKCWGSIVNRTRDLARLASATVDDEAACGRIINFTAAFAIGAKQQLRGEKTPSEYFGLIEEPELEDMMTAAHVPLVILDKISWTIKRLKKAGKLSDMEVYAFQNDLGLLEDQMGACERVLRTPLPFIYVVHLRTVLALWLLTLPLAMAVNIRWFAIPVCIAIGFFLIGLDDAAVELENPFGKDFNDLPLDTITTTIRGNLMEVKARAQRMALEAY